MKRWKDLGWITARGNTVKNKGLWELTDEMLQGNAVSFVNEEDETLLRLWKAVG